jgi:hypothetical protein
MSTRRYSRRDTIKMLAAVPALSAATRPLQRRATPARKGSVRLGGPIPGAANGGPAPDPVELAREARQLGYRAMLCPRVDLKDTPRIRAIEAACKAEDVVIAEVGAFGFRDPRLEDLPETRSQSSKGSPYCPPRSSMRRAHQPHARQLW